LIKFFLSFTSLIVLFCYVPLVALAGALPFKLPSKDEAEIKPVDSEGFLGAIIGDLGALIAPAYSWGVSFITILFVVGTLVMIMSALFKNGQWQKYGQITMLLSFLTMLLLRGLPIVVLSIRTTSDINILLSESLSMLGFAAIFLCFISVGVSFLFGFGYRLIEHPEFHRWAKNLRGVSVLMLLFAIAIPYLFPIL